MNPDQWGIYFNSISQFQVDSRDSSVFLEQMDEWMDGWMDG
jgi:hypothetical protein